MPLFVRGMVVGDGQIVVAGPPDLVDSEQALVGLAADDEVMRAELVRQDAALAG